MKVFKYDIETGTRGDHIADMRVPQSFSNPKMASCVMPANIPSDQEWSVSTVCRDHNNELVFYPYPVCFCLGQMRAGQDPWFWDWKILLTGI